MFGTSLAKASTLIAVALTPQIAHAGWTAKLTSSSGGQKQSAELYFDNDWFRTDADKSPSLIIDLNSGKLTILNHEQKKHATVTLDEMVKLRDKNIAELKAQLPKMPPDVKKQVEDQIKLMEGQGPGAKKDLVLKDQKKKDKVNGYDCSVYTWSAVDGDGEACIADKIAGMDPQAFKRATEKLADKLALVSGGPGTYAILVLGKHGFPVRTKQKIKFGDTQIEVVSELQDLKPASLDRAKFEPPKDYAKSDLMAALGQPVP